MPHKRKNKKEKKKDSMFCIIGTSSDVHFLIYNTFMSTYAEKGKKKMISAPLNVRHVGMEDVLEQLQTQSKFPVEVQ